MAKARKSKAKGNTQAKRGKRRNRNRAMIDSEPRRWMRLLMDPCTADLAYPCYGGSDAGYLVRTVDVHTVAFSGSFTTGQAIRGDAYVAWTPANLSTTTGLRTYAVAAGGTLDPVNAGFTNFITSNHVRSYRAVASCMKFIPTGAIGTRAGVVGLGYVPSVAAMGSGAAGHFLAQCQKKASTGSESHEVNWIPSAADENFTTTGDYNDAGCGTAFCVLKDIDCTATSTTNAVVNGYVEVTTVWEWTPAMLSNLAVDARTPSPYTSQQVLAMFGDVTNVLYAGAKNAAVSMARMAGRGGAAAAIEYATRSFMGSSNMRATFRGPSMPLLTY